MCPRSKINLLRLWARKCYSIDDVADGSVLCLFNKSPELRNMDQIYTDSKM